jgi:hypothetical protein
MKIYKLTIFQDFTFFHSRQLTEARHKVVTVCDYIHATLNFKLRKVTVILVLLSSTEIFSIFYSSYLPKRKYLNRCVFFLILSAHESSGSYIELLSPALQFFLHVST